MIKVFIRGFVFGSGLYAALLLFDFIASTYFQNPEISIPVSGKISTYGWHDLPDQERISKASVLAVVRYSEGDDGSMVAQITEIYKDEESIEFSYNIGDMYPDLNYYPNAKSSPRSGAVIFFAGSPAEYMSAPYLYDDRLIGFGDMPLSILIVKFKDDA